MELGTVRDIAIIVLAVESIIIGVVLTLLLLQLRDLTRLLQDEIEPILDSARRAVGTVKGTTLLVSETIVSPAIKISGFATGLRRVLEVLVRRKHRQESAPPSDRPSSLSESDGS